MKKIKLEIEFEYDDELMHGDDQDSKDWFYNNILMNEELILHSNEIGDEIGFVKGIRVVE